MGEAMAMFGRRAGELVLDISRGIGETEPAFVNSLRALEGSCAETYAIGQLMQGTPVPAIAVVVLARSSVESLGRAWRVLKIEDQDERNQLARELRVREIDRAQYKGLNLHRRSGAAMDDEFLRNLNAKRNEDYAAVAVSALCLTGQTRALAEAMYSFMSGVAHGESLSIEALSKPVGDQTAYILTKQTTNELMLALFLSGNHVLSRFIELYAPSRLEELAAISRDVEPIMTNIFDQR